MAFNSRVLVPVLKADDDEKELVDPQAALREKCQAKGHIASLYNKYQECNDRVNIISI